MMDAFPGRMVVEAAEPSRSMIVAASLAGRLAQEARRETGSSAVPEHGLALAAALVIARHLRFDPADPAWPDRDRMVFAAASVAVARTAEKLLEPAGVAGFRLGERVEDGRRALGVAVGLAQAARVAASRFGRSLVDHRVWFLGDCADLLAGEAQEAASVAGQLRLGRLAALVVCRAADGALLGSLAAKGWVVREVASSSADEIGSALSACLRSHRPTLIVCCDTKDCQDGGRQAVPSLEQGQENAAWMETGRRGTTPRRSWLKRLARHAARQEFDRAYQRRMPMRWHDLLADCIPSPGPATIAAPASTAQKALSRLVSGPLPELLLLAGAARITPEAAATRTAPEAAAARIAPDANGDVATGVTWGTQVHASSAMLYGIALHGSAIAAATMPARDIAACLPALRQAASSGLHLVQVFVEPAPEQRRAWFGADPALVRALRAIDGLAVFEPADATEALECLELAMRRIEGPNVIIVSDTPVPLLAVQTARTRSSHGGYVVREAAGPRDVTLMGSGRNLVAALQLGDGLKAHGLAAAVVSVPCASLFAVQDVSWKSNVLGGAPVLLLEDSVLAWVRQGRAEELLAGAFSPGKGEAAVRPDKVAAFLEALRRGRQQDPQSPA